MSKMILTRKEAEDLAAEIDRHFFDSLESSVAMSSDGPYPVPENVQRQIDAQPSALDVQVAGNHYKSLTIQPVEYIHANKVGYFEGNVIKYVTRWRDKGGIADLEKAQHYIQLLIELEKGPHPKQTK